MEVNTMRVHRMRANQDIKTEAMNKEIPMWLIADKLGISIGSLTRRLHRELPVSEKKKIFAIIEHLSKVIIK